MPSFTFKEVLRLYIYIRPVALTFLLAEYIFSVRTLFFLFSGKSRCTTLIFWTTGSGQSLSGSCHVMPSRKPRDATLMFFKCTLYVRDGQTILIWSWNNVDATQSLRRFLLKYFDPATPNLSSTSHSKGGIREEVEEERKEPSLVNT